VIETDAHLIRELPAGYVAEHVEHAYALTGHGMQGGTVEQASSSPARTTSRAAGPTPRSHAPAARPGYSCATRARGGGREEYAPAHDRHREHGEVLRASRGRCSSATTRTSRSTSSPRGRADDPQLTQPAGRAAARSSKPSAPSRGLQPVSGHALGELREQLERLRAQLAALPTVELEQLDDLDARARELTERRDLLRGELERLPAPRSGASAAARTRTSSTAPASPQRSPAPRTSSNASSRSARRSAASSATSRGDPRGTRRPDERDRHARAPAHRAAQRARRPRSRAAAAVGARRARRTTRPPALTRERWDRAARTIARYRIEYEIPANSSAKRPDTTSNSAKRTDRRAGANPLANDATGARLSPSSRGGRPIRRAKSWCSTVSRATACRYNGQHRPWQ
jgi:hypothetical protein